VLVLGVLSAPWPAWAIDIERVVTPGGVEAWLVREPTIPVISFNFAFRGGAALDPAGKEGLAEMVSALLDEGAGPLDSQAFQRRLSDLAISLRFQAGRDTFGGTLRTLSENREAAFDLLRLALTEPRFDAEPVERIRSQLLSGLARSAEDPDQIAGRTWSAALFPDHPYGRPVSGTKESINAVAGEDLTAFVAARLARDNLLIGVAGDITAEDLAPLLDRTFAGLPAEAVPDTVPETKPRADGELIVVERDIPQSVVVFGHGGVKRDDPDYYAVYVMNYILGGGGFVSRLNHEVRQKRGLAYSVYSYLQPLEHAGIIAGGVATENARLAESLEVIRAEWRRLREGGVTNEELANAKRYLTGSFPLRLDNTRKLAGNLVAIQVSRLGIDYLDRRNSLIEAVTGDDVRRVAERLIHPDALTVVVVGQPEGVAATREPPPDAW
jgi:zinc protease